MDIEKITGHQLVRGRGGKLAVMYETHWEGLSSITWEREIDLRNFSRYILEYWMSTPRQVKGVNSKYRAMRRMLAEEFYTTDVDGVPGSWCLQSHIRDGIFRDTDMSREAYFQES